jgi:hypothetical protein
MKLQKIQSTVNHEETYLWIKGIAEFLTSVFGETISHEQVVALMQIMTRFSIKLRNGTVINDKSNQDRAVWLADAAVIASALCEEPDKDAGWWKAEFPSFNKENAAYDVLVASMVGKIRVSPQVLAIEAL